MRLSGISLAEAAQMAVRGRFEPDSPELAIHPESPSVAFLRVADAYSGNVPEKTFAALGRLATQEKFAEPSIAAAVAGVHFVAQVIAGPNYTVPKDYRALADQLLRGKDSHARTAGLWITHYLNRRAKEAQVLDGIGTSLGLWLNSTGKWHVAPAVLAYLLGGKSVEATAA